MKTYKTLGFALAVLLTTSVAIAAPLPSEGDFQRLDKMEQTDYGFSIGVKGYIQTARRGGVEQFGVRLFMDQVDIRRRQHFIVEVTNQAGTFEIGVIETFLGSGDLQLINTRNASEVFPLANVSALVVRDKNDVVLSLRF